jgi:hypothetical protein
MQFKVQSTSIANHLPANITTPNRGCRSAAIGARQIFLARIIQTIVGIFAVAVVIVIALVGIFTGPQVIVGSIAHFDGGTGQGRRVSDLLQILRRGSSTWTGLLSAALLFLRVLLG